MLAAGTNKLVFSSTAAVYGEPKSVPIVETAELAPTNAYGESKLLVEQMLTVVSSRAWAQLCGAAVLQCGRGAAGARGRS